MKVTLQDQIKYIDRCINPDYIIIIKNKAGEMNFEEFKVVTKEVKIERPKRFKFTIQAVEDKSNIIIYDNFEKRFVVDMICKKEKEEQWLSKFKKEYGTRDILRQI